LGVVTVRGADVGGAVVGGAVVEVVVGGVEVVVVPSAAGGALCAHVAGVDEPATARPPAATVAAATAMNFRRRVPDVLARPRPDEKGDIITRGVRSEPDKLAMRPDP
jgi:hypothetical protein